MNERAKPEAKEQELVRGWGGNGTGVLLCTGVVEWGQRDSRRGSSRLGVTAKYLKVGDLARNS